jgi:hypothetical protein
MSPAFDRRRSLTTSGPRTMPSPALRTRGSRSFLTPRARGLPSAARLAWSASRFHVVLRSLRSFAQ